MSQQIDFLYLSEPDMIAAGVTDMAECLDTMTDMLALFARGEGDHRAHQRQDDRKEGEVLDKAHASSPFRRRSIII